jgi:hypothetical protein
MAIEQVSLTDVSVVPYTAPPVASAEAILSGGSAMLVIVALEGDSGIFLGVSGPWSSLPKIGDLITATGRRPNGATYVSPVLLATSTGHTTILVGPYPLPQAAAVTAERLAFPKRGAFPTPKEVIDRATPFVQSSGPTSDNIKAPLTQTDKKRD